MAFLVQQVNVVLPSLWIVSDPEESEVRIVGFLPFVPLLSLFRIRWSCILARRRDWDEPGRCDEGHADTLLFSFPSDCFHYRRL